MRQRPDRLHHRLQEKILHRLVVARQPVLDLRRSLPVSHHDDPQGRGTFLRRQSSRLRRDPVFDSHGVLTGTVERERLDPGKTSSRRGRGFTTPVYRGPPVVLSGGVVS